MVCGAATPEGCKNQGQTPLSSPADSDHHDLLSNARLTLNPLGNAMIASMAKAILLGLALVGETLGQYDPTLVGTWSTKSKKVVTGPVCTLPLCRGVC